MSEEKPDFRKGFERGKDGVLVWVGGVGARYNDPGEAVKCQSGGQLRLSCTDRVYGLFSRGICGKTAKHDPDANGNPTKCGNHSKAAYERREAKKDATNARWGRQWNADHEEIKAKKALEAALEQIASGHNDPRQLAVEALARLKAARAAVKAAYAKT